MTAAPVTSHDRRCALPGRGAPAPIRIGLLGLGHVGSAVARLTRVRTRSRPAHVEITAALVRDPGRPRAMPGLTVTTDPEAVFATRPSVVVETLGGLEPARTLVLDAIARGIPVVTANKSLLAHHGDEIAEAAAFAGVPLRFEASVLAGVPFLGTFARRPYASALTSITGIVNGTTNFILSQMQDGTREYAAALFDAQQRGFAEPDPGKDVGGIDAVEKLAILIRHFGGPSVRPTAIETTGIEHITTADLLDARALGGTLKPIVWAEALGRDAAAVSAFAGPAFVPDSHPLAGVRQVANGLCLRDIAGSDLCFTGPGAGPDVTAVTVLDDVIEVTSSGRDTGLAHRRVYGLTRDTEAWADIVAPPTAWFVRLTSEATLPSRTDVANLLGAHAIRVERGAPGDTRNDRASLAILIRPCPRAQIERVAAALVAATGSATRIFRALEPPA